MRRKLLNFYMEVRRFRTLKDDDKFYETPPWSWTSYDNPVKDYDAFMACRYLYDSKKPDAESEMVAVVLAGQNENFLGKYSLSSLWMVMADMREVLTTSVMVKAGRLEVDA